MWRYFQLKKSFNGRGSRDGKHLSVCWQYSPFVGLLLLLIAACTVSTVQAKVLVFSRSGGFAGISDELTIDLESGKARLHYGKEVIAATLPDAQRIRLQALIADLDLTSLSATTQSSDQCCDLLTYRVQIDTTVIQVTDADLPPRLQPLIAELNSITTDLMSQRLPD
jgi:hypothetical protein